MWISGWIGSQGTIGFLWITHSSGDGEGEYLVRVDQVACMRVCFAYDEHENELINDHLETEAEIQD